MMWLRDNFFSYILLGLIVVVALVSYVRFMVLGDYIVAYEGDCDPYTESCFIGCEDDECTEEYYYSSVQKYAPNLEAQCGTDITNCDAAYECLSEDGSHCEIMYCDPATDGGDACEMLTEADMDEVGFDEEIATEEVESINEDSDTEQEESITDGELLIVNDEEEI